MKNKQIDHISNIMTKLHHLFSKIQEKLNTCRNSNVKDFRRLYLGDYIHVKFIPQQPVLLILNNFKYI